MISEWFLSLASGFVSWLAGLFGEWEPPESMSGAADTIAALLTGMAGFGVWVDFGVLAACVAVGVATWALVIGIKLLRAVAAHIPFLGGAGD